MKQLFPQACLLLAMILWASSFIALKYAFSFYDPQVVIFGRMLIGSLCFLCLRLKYRYAFTYQKGDYRLILFMVFCEPCLYYIFEAQALVYTTASQAGMITAIMPVLVMGAAAIFLRERTRRGGWAGALLAVAGVVWLTLDNRPQVNALNPVLGNSLEFLAMVCGTGYTIIMRKLTVRYSPFFLTAMQAIAGCFFYFPFLFLPSTVLPHSFHLPAVLAVCYLGAGITLGAYGLFNYALKFVSASRSSMFINLIPVFSVFLGWFLLGERLSGRQFVAAALVLVGVWFSQQGSRETE